MSKPIRLRLLMAVAAFAGVAAAYAAPAPTSSGGFQTPVPNAILIEAESGTVLFEKSADQLVPPSSLAKLMTAEVVFDQVALGNIKLDEEFVVSENAWRRGGAPSGGSTMYAAIHSKIKIRDLLSGVVIQSANDGCIVLAEGIAGNEAAFARLMNDRARELGLDKLNFTNSTGLPDPQQRVTVRELAKLAQHIIHTYPDQYKLYSEREFTWNKIRQQNRNPLLVMNIGADGMKTGFTREAGYGLVGSAVQNGLRLIVVINGAKHEKERADEARKLLEWGFRGFETRLLFAEGQTVAEAKVYGGAKGSVTLTGKGPINLMVPRGVSDRITAKMIYTGPVRAPIQQGQPIGKLQVWRNDTLALEAPLQAAEDVGTGGTARRAFDAASELFIGVLRAGVGKI
jgi:serine-type D-Ala-D-Ala carboxypeptidase (penicillin-binding protein 5/6)